MPELSVTGPFNTPFSPLPCGKRKSIPFNMGWDTTDEYTINFTSAIQLTTIDSVQSLFVDNFNNSNAVTIVETGSGMRVIIPASSYAYLPFITREYPNFVITSTALATQRTFILANNFPIPTQVITP